jgi:hypothetical protein
MYILGVQKAATTSIAATLETCGLAAFSLPTQHTVHFSEGVCTQVGVPCKESLHPPLVELSGAGKEILQSQSKRKQFSELYSTHSCGQGKSGNGPLGAYGPNGVSKNACTEMRFIGASPDVGVADGSLFKAYPSHLASKARFVMILREPVSRMLSWYNHIILDSDPRFRQQKSNQGQDISTFHEFAKSEWEAYNIEKHNPYNPYGRGMYSKSLLHFADATAGLRRKQLLLLNFDTVVTDAAGILKALTTHFGVPILTHHSVLPDSNSHDAPSKVVSINCETQSMAENHFKPDLQHVYRLIEDAHEHGFAPHYEPHFPKFDLAESVHCLPHQETTLGEARRNPSLISRLEERMEHLRIAEYDDIDDTIEDEIMRRRMLTSRVDSNDP